MTFLTDIDINIKDMHLTIKDGKLILNDNRRNISNSNIISNDIQSVRIGLIAGLLSGLFSGGWLSDEISNSYNFWFRVLHIPTTDPFLLWGIVWALIYTSEIIIIIAGIILVINLIPGGLINFILNFGKLIKNNHSS
jgi:hypothetical protein